jgi:anti-sigma factor RsiW
MRRFHLESMLHDFLTGECDEATRLEVESLLERDAKARALLEEMRDAHEALQLLRNRPAPQAPVDDIRRAIASHVFAGKPEPVMTAWGTRFYKRVAAAAVLLCGASVGFAVHHSLSTPAPNALERPASTDSSAASRNTGSGNAPEATVRAPSETIPPASERGRPVRGIDAFELMSKTNGNLVTVTPTDAVMPLYEPQPR